MELLLGQKVKYKTISKKIKMGGDNYVTLENFIPDPDSDDWTKTIKRRKLVILDKPRIGYIVGKRRVIADTVLKKVYESDPELHDYIDIECQLYYKVYLVAWSMGKMDCVLGVDLMEPDGQDRYLCRPYQSENI